MPGAIEYFYDSYAIIAMLSGSGNYSRFKFSEGLTTVMNLMEVQYYLLRKRFSNTEIKETISQLSSIGTGFSNEDCFSAVQFRFKNKKKKLSYVDCLGYVLAKNNKWSFVTGDKEFEDLSNVVYVKC